jgi:hypothetical protein
MLQFLTMYAPRTVLGFDILLLFRHLSPMRAVIAYLRPNRIRSASDFRFLLSVEVLRRNLRTSCILMYVWIPRSQDSVLHGIQTGSVGLLLVKRPKKWALPRLGVRVHPAQHSTQPFLMPLSTICTSQTRGIGAYAPPFVTPPSFP